MASSRRRLIYRAVLAAEVVLLLGVALAMVQRLGARALAQQPVVVADGEWAGAARSRALAAEKLSQPYDRLKTLHLPKTAPRPGEWLERHFERGQSFAEYQLGQPVRPTPRERTLYLQPVGPFAKEQYQVVELTADYLQRFFSVTVKLAEPIAATAIPAKARRDGGEPYGEQWLTTFILDDLLAARRPPDALAVVALTATDLWAGPGWNFVYGQASLRERVGVWSLRRHGDPRADAAELRLCLKRTIATATHETGHLLSIEHCIAYECLMNGVNHREEADSRPFDLCPACLRKLCWNVKTEPLPRYRALAEFCRQQQWVAELAPIEKAIKVCEEGGK